jgi:hypothetical protein
MVRAVSVPQIPGYTASRGETNLLSLWGQPEGAYPKALWPRRHLNDIDPNPSGWVTVDEHFFTKDEHGGRGCVLVDVGSEDAALRDTSWTGRDLGEFNVWSSPGGENGYANGLASDRGHVSTEFFVQMRKATGASLPQVEVALRHDTLLRINLESFTFLVCQLRLETSRR